MTNDYSALLAFNLPQLSLTAVVAGMSSRGCLPAWHDTAGHCTGLRGVFASLYNTEDRPFQFLRSCLPHRMSFGPEASLVNQVHVSNVKQLVSKCLCTVVYICFAYAIINR